VEVEDFSQELSLAVHLERDKDAGELVAGSVVGLQAHGGGGSIDVDAGDEARTRSRPRSWTSEGIEELVRLFNRAQRPVVCDFLEAVLDNEKLRYRQA